MYKKGFVFGIVILFIGASVAPGISGKHGSSKDTEESPVTTTEVSNSATLSLHTFDKTVENKCNAVLAEDVAYKIHEILGELRYKITYEPRNDETKDLKIKLVNLLYKHGLIPDGLSKDYVLSLLNPSWFYDNQEVPGEGSSAPLFRSFMSPIGRLIHRLQQFLKIRYAKINHRGINGDILPSLLQYPGTGIAAFCSISSAGNGVILPLFLLPRPRAAAMWLSRGGVTLVGELATVKGFVAAGAQIGLALGFMGLGLTYSLPGYTLYGFIGYALFTSVSATEIEFFPPNQPPVISNENPPNGAVDVPLSLSELSFRIRDPEGELMSYTVTTNPDIGSGSGILKPNGVYYVPMSDLEPLTEYTWHIEVSDGQVIAIKDFTFTTEPVAPIISNPSPEDGEKQVPVSLSELSFHLKDSQNDPMDYTVETVPDIGSGGGNGVGEGTYSISVSGLDYLTDYKWYVNATDGVHDTSKVFSFQTQPIMIFDPFDMGLQYRKKITIDHTMVDGNLENFPVLISLTDADLRDKAQNDGDDILFMDGPGIATRLFHEIEYYEDSNGGLVAWVNIPSLSSGLDTVLYMYYGNSDCSSQEFPERVWDSSYCSVWHLDNFLDSTKNGNDGTNYGTDDCYGKIGKAKDFIRTNEDFISFNDMSEPADNSITTATFEMWINIDDFLNSNRLISKANSGDYGPDRLSYIGGISSDRTISFQLWCGTWFSEQNIINFHTNEPCVVAGYWQHISVVIDLSEKNANIYYNGEEKDNKVTIEGTPPEFFYDIKCSEELGRMVWEGAANRFNGAMDEVRISKTCRSEAWIITSYNTMNDPLSFFSVGPEESAP